MNIIIADVENYMTTRRK